MPVFASRFEGVTTLARHSMSHAVRRILNDKNYNQNLASSHRTISGAPPLRWRSRCASRATT